MAAGHCLAIASDTIVGLRAHRPRSIRTWSHWVEEIQRCIAVERLSTIIVNPYFRANGIIELIAKCVNAFSVCFHVIPFDRVCLPTEMKNMRTHVLYRLPKIKGPPGKCPEGPSDIALAGSYLKATRLCSDTRCAIAWGIP